MSTQPRMVRLLQCTRRSCQKVFPDDEMAFVETEIGEEGTCPHCGCPTQYSIGSNGIVVRLSDHTRFDLNTLPAIPVHPKAGKRVKEGIAALVRRLTGEKPAGPEWRKEDGDAEIYWLETPFLDLRVSGPFNGRWLAGVGLANHEWHPTREAAQSAAIARAVELVEGTLAILKP